MPSAAATRTVGLLVLLAMLVHPTAGGSMLQPPGFGTKPHLITIIMDDFGWNSVGFHGHNPEIQTPTMDALALSGLRLDRHYVFKYCSPTRSSLLSGRLPIHVNQNNDANNSSSTSGIDLRMVLLPQLLKAQGYGTHLVGKSHIGARSLANLPVNRGFDSNLGCFKAGDHVKEISGQCPGRYPCVDLWKDRGPAFGLNGTLYTAELYTRRATDIIRQHNRSQPLFLYVGYQMTHTPLDPPATALRPSHWPQYKTPERLAFNAMAALLDEGIANITRSLKTQNMWENCLVLATADNGAWIVGPPGVHGGALGGGSNFPLRGGKVSDFEGGTRAVAFLSGGFLPSHLRGTTHGGLLHVCDWLSTYAHLAGVEPSVVQQHHPDVPAVDSINAWPRLLVPNITINGSIALGGRSEVPLSYGMKTADIYPSYPYAHGYPMSLGDAALIVGEWKIIVGKQVGIGYHQGTIFPNTSAHSLSKGKYGDQLTCEEGCLFHVSTDETESVDQKEAQPELFSALLKRMHEVGATTKTTNWSDQPHSTCMGAKAVFDYWSGYSGPVCIENRTSRQPWL